MHNYPAIIEQANYHYGGHGNQVMVVSWSFNDQYLISVGGNDKSVFQWKLVNERTPYILNYTALRNYNKLRVPVV